MRAWLFCWAETASAQVPLEMRLFWTQVSGQRWSPSIVRGAASGIMLSGFFVFFFLFTITRESFGKKKFTWGKNDHRLRFLGSMMNTQSEKSTLIRIDSLLLKIYI